MMADELLNAQDLITAKKHDTFHSEVITGKTGGLSTGADIDYATNAVTGQVQKTLPATIDGLDWSYVGLFADGVTFTKKTDFAVDAVGTQWIYTGSLPFTATSATVPSEPTYQAVHVKSASAISNANGGSVQDFIDNDVKNIIGISSNEAFSADSIDFGSSIGHSDNGCLIVVGDSITQGTGSSAGSKQFASLLARAYFNTIGHGYNADRGFEYETIFNMSQEYSRGYIGGAATIGANYIQGSGAVNSALRVPQNESLTVTNRSVLYGDIIYDGSASTATHVEIYLNGALMFTKAISSGVGTTFPSLINGGIYTYPTDVISFKAIGGHLVVTGLAVIRGSSISGFLFVAAQSGTEFDFHSSKVSSLVSHVNTLASSRSKTVLIALGTNTIYNSSANKNPAGYITALDGLINQYKAGFGSSTKFVVTVPMRSNESLFPAKLGQYSAYVKAIVQYCYTNKIQCIRLDRCAHSIDHSLYSDGLHPNDTGHYVLAKYYAKSLELSNKLTRHTDVIDDRAPVKSGVTYSDAWGDFAVSTPARVSKMKNRLYLSGLVKPNGSTSLAILTTPLGHRPSRDMYLIASSDSSFVRLKWFSSGVLSIIGTIPTWISLDGVSVDIS